MAIINDIPGLSVEVVSNGDALREYEDVYAADEPKKVTKYIEVQSDETFEIVARFLENLNAKYGVCVEIRLDGTKVSASLIRLGELRKGGGHTYTTSGVMSKIGNRWHESNFLFSPFVVGKSPVTYEPDVQIVT
jgi:hypothetical protein